MTKNVQNCYFTMERFILSHHVLLTILLFILSILPERILARVSCFSPLPVNSLTKNALSSLVLYSILFAIISVVENTTKMQLKLQLSKDAAFLSFWNPDIEITELYNYN